MAKVAARIVFLEAVLFCAGTAVVSRSFWLQVVHHQVWIDKGTNRRERDDVLLARRGRILDRNGDPMAVTQEQYRIRVGMNEVRDTNALRAILIEKVGIAKARVTDLLRNDYPYFYGPFGAEQVEALRGVRGVHLDVLYDREYPMKTLANRILGRLNETGDQGIEGMEKALDTLLQGRPGRIHYLIDSRGNRIPDPGPPMVEPIPGRDVELTLDNNLQGIAEGALRRGIETNNALGGDLVIIDVHTGELLAVASLRTDVASRKMMSTSSAIVEPNEPGSTSKLFTVAAMLKFGADTTPVDGEGGKWFMNVGGRKPREINDVHKLSGPVTLGETVKYSSNIAISKFAMRLTPDQQYETIRNFGFGTQPGLGFPGEAPGLLRRPSLWENRLLSQPSLGQGYEWEATAVQLAAGYAAFANHGFLMAPTLLRQVRDDHGSVSWQHRADTVRRAVPDSIAAHLLEYLSMTEGAGGTGAHAQLDRFPVPGKTGTAKVLAGGYRGSFAGIFPAGSPQVVVYVMIDRPNSGKIYGGDVAAPVVKQVLQQALLATQSPLDRRWMMESPVRLDSTPAPVPAAPVLARKIPLPLRAANSLNEMLTIPAVAGQRARDAVVMMQQAGFHVRLVGRAHVRSSSPAVGDSLPRGGVVTIYADSTR